MSFVACVAGELRRKAVADAVAALGEDFVARIKSANEILIKPDLGHHTLQLAATHADAVRGILDVIRPLTEVRIVIGDASHYGTGIALRNFGYDSLTKEYINVTLRDLQESEALEHVAQGKNGPIMIRRAKEALTPDMKISLASLKTHRLYGACLSVANWIEGTWLVPPRIGLNGRVFARGPWLTAEGDGMHALMAHIYDTHPADVAVIDGMLGMEGDGPVEGSALHVGVALAGMDPLAVDAVGATLMSIDPRALGYLDLLAKQGRGNVDVADMNIPLQLLLERTRMFQLPYEQRGLRGG